MVVARQPRADLRGRRARRRPRDRRSRPRAEPVPGRARRRPHHRRDARHRARRGGTRDGAGVRARAPPVRAADLQVPGHPVQAGRHRRPAGSREAACRAGRTAARRRRAVRARGRHGQAARIRARRQGGVRGGADPRRVRLHAGVPGIPLLPGCEGAGDRRGDQRNPADRDRASPGLLMRALRWHAAGDLRIEDVPEPATPGPGMAIVEVAACGICGSDLAEFRAGPKMIRTSPHPLTGRQAPLTLGHEFSGRVVAAADEEAWPPGTRVTADACWRCEHCEACVNGDYHMCRYGGSIGLHSDGAFAPYVAVPEYTLVGVPDGVSDAAAAMTEPLAVGLHALDRGQTRAGDAVLVLGFGPIGAAAALLARAVGATPIVIEIDEARRARAEGLDLATLEVGEDLPRRVRRAVGGGGAPVVIESTGVAAVLPQAVECARRGGRIVAVGLTGEPSELDSSRLTFYERSLVGSLGYRHDLPRVARMMADGLVDPERLISGTVPLGDAPQTFASLASEPGDRVKVMVDPHG